MVCGKMRGGLGVSSWLLIAITILVILQLFSMVGVSGAQMSHRLHGNCLKVLNITMTCWGWSTQLCGICHIMFQRYFYFQLTLRLASLNDSKMPSNGVNMAIVQDVVQGNKKFV
jgi:hypothetical protein